MKRYDAIKKIVENLEDELVISNIGVPSKELHEINDRNKNFYMLGSMGMATPIGFGLAVALEKQKNDRKVIVIDGDGSVLMNLGELVTIYSQNPSNLIIALIDNESYGSTGSQETYASQVNLSDIAKAIGFKKTYYYDCKEDMNINMDTILNKEGPVLLHLKVKPGNSEAPNIKLTPSEIKNRFMKEIQK